MKLIEAFDFVGAQRPAWRTQAGSWRPPFCYNRSHLLRLLGADTDVSSITKADLAQVRNDLLNEPMANKSGRRSVGGVNRIMSMISCLLRELEDNDIIHRAPRLKGLRENNTRTNWFSRAQVEKMVTVAKEELGNRLLASAILTAAFTGARQSELLNLKVKDVNFMSDQVQFRDTKNGTDHLVDIHTSLRPVLRQLCEDKQGDDPVFDFTNDDQLRREFYRVRDLCGISEDYVWHSLRHSTATWLAENGVPLVVIARVLNHKTITTTQRYAKASDKARREAINTL